MSKIPTLQQLLEAGVHFGHQVRRGHPRMGEYIYGVREGVHVINLELTEEMLIKAAEYAKSLGKTGKTILFVGTKKQAQPIIKELAEKIGAPYINYRWIGGLLTNFEEIRRNIKKLTDLQEKGEKGELSHYTKKERLLISRKLGKFDKEWGGIINMEGLPDAVFIVDCVAEKTALTEANRLEIPVIAITDTNSNPYLVNYPIPGNDDSTKSIRLLTETIASGYNEGKGTVKEKTETKAEKPKKEETELTDEEIAAQVAAAEEEVEKKTVEESERKEKGEEK